MLMGIRQMEDPPKKDCHAGGRGFESRPVRHIQKSLALKGGAFLCLPGLGCTAVALVLTSGEPEEPRVEY